MSKPASNARDEWREGWALVLACFFGFSFFSVTTASAGVFMQPIASEFGWSRTLVSSGVSIGSVMTALLSPFFGIFLDRYGSRRLALPGLVITAFAMAGIGLANGSPTQWLALWIFYAAISIAVKTTVWTAAVSGVFSHSRGLALGFTLSGVAAAQIVSPPLSYWLIEQYGWRMAYACLGFGWGSVTLLLSWLFLYDAHDRRRAAAAHGQSAAPVEPALPGITVAQAWRSVPLWMIAASTFLMMLLSLGLQVHQVPILTGAGMARSSAAWLVGLFGVTGIIGKLVTGWLMDRYRANWIGGLTLSLNGLAFLMLTDAVRTPALIVVAIALNGYAAGCKLQICTLLTSRFAGMRNFGKIYGVMTGIVALGSGLGPMVAGQVFDRTGSYGAFLIAGAIGCVICGWLIAILPPCPEWGAPDWSAQDGTAEETIRQPV